MYPLSRANSFEPLSCMYAHTGQRYVGLKTVMIPKFQRVAAACLSVLKMVLGLVC